MEFLKLTIFQRMLVAPLLGMLLYSAYLLYTHNEHQQSSASIEQIRDGYLPILELVGENVLLFSSIVDSLKDAVLAGERDWVINTRESYNQMQANLQRLTSYPDLLPKKEVESAMSQLSDYYRNAYALSMTLLGEPTDTDDRERLIENVERSHNKVKVAFERMKLGVEQRLSTQVDETNQRLRQILWIGVGMGVLLMVLITGISFALSLWTRRSLNEVNTALKNMAQETPDFSARLTRSSADELGELVGWFNLLSDKLEQDYKKIELLSITDKLTQLNNRTKIDDLFQMELNKSIRYQEPLSVILLDLDHFKSVNDAFGHQVGDIVLQELARVLRENVRECDHLGRWGGEEFIIIAPNSDLAQASLLAEKLRAAIADFAFSEVKHKTGSFGVASYHEGDSEDSMSKRADDCLYLAKERGRNIVIDETML